MRNKILSLCVLSSIAAAPTFAADDKFLWLEAVEGEKSLEWVKQQNAHSEKEIKSYKGFDELVSNNLAILNNKERIPYASRMDGYLYNFWKDQNHVRGIYRRTTMEEYTKAEPKWETVLDIDTLGKAEGVNWVYKGMDCRYPNYDRCMVSLSRGGADAVEVREFDLKQKVFLDKKSKPFALSEAKSSVSWIDKDTVFVGTDFGDGNSLTDSGYPKIVKQWQRGTPLSAAKTIFSGSKASVSVSGYVIYDDKKPLQLITESLTFYTAQHYAYRKDKLVSLPLPMDADIKGYFNDQLYIELKSDLNASGKIYKQGAIIYTDLDKLIAQNLSLVCLSNQLRQLQFRK